MSLLAGIEGWSDFRQASNGDRVMRMSPDGTVSLGRECSGQTWKSLCLFVLS